MDPDRRIGDGWLEDLLTCVHCGFCLPVCPTYEVLSEENDSPRGRIYLMRAVAEGRAEAADAQELHLGRCLGCRACETACPAGVEYGSLLERARDRSTVEDLSRRLLDLTLRWMTAPGLSRVTWSLARLARSSRLSAVAARLVPGRTGLAARMLDSTRPSAADRRPGRESPLAEADGTGMPEQDAWAPGNPGSYALLEGCVMAGLYPHVHAATRRTLARRRFREREAPGQGCCGALHAHAGRLDGARDLARANIEAFERSGARWIVTNSAGCGAALRDYPSWFREDRELRRRAGKLAARVRDVTELLSAPGPGSREVPSSPLRIAYDAPCHLLHAQGVRDAPMEALSAAGYDVTPLPSWERCCGGAGLYNLLQPELSDEVLARKLREIGEGEFDLVATGNPGCMMFLASGLARAGTDVGVVHPVQLIDRAEWNAGRGRQVSPDGTKMVTHLRRGERAR